MFSVLVQFYPSNWGICSNARITLESLATLPSLYLWQKRCYFVLEAFHGWPLSKHELFQSLKNSLPATLNINPSESKTRKPAVWLLDSSHHQQLQHFCAFDRFFCFTCIKALSESNSMISWSKPTLEGQYPYLQQVCLASMDW